MCMNNNKIYIGKAVNIRARLTSHKSVANRGRGKCHFQYALVKHGWNAFKVEILEIFEDFDKNNEDHKSKIAEMEALYIKRYNSTDKNIGYNLCKYSNDRTGVRCSEETKAKLRISNSVPRKPLSEKHKENLSKVGKNRIFTEEHREKLRISAKKRGISKETREKMRLTNTGRPLSEEHKAALSKAQMGRTVSQETREKIRLSNLNQTRSDETKEKMRLRMLGSKHSDETKEKMRQSSIGQNVGRKHSEESKEKMRRSKMKEL